MDSELAQALDRIYDSDGVLMGHGSFFSENQKRAQDIDLIRVTAQSGGSFNKTRVLLGLRELDLSQINIRYLRERFRFEARSGYQFLSRSIVTSILLMGNETTYQMLRGEAKQALAWDPRETGKDFARLNKQNLVLILNDLGRLRSWHRKASFISSFEHLMRIGFYVRGEWITPPSCCQYWSDNMKQFVENVCTGLQAALNGDETVYLKSIKDEVLLIDNVL